MSDHFFFGTIRHESIVTVILVFCMNNKRIDLVLKNVYIYIQSTWMARSVNLQWIRSRQLLIHIGKLTTIHVQVMAICPNTPLINYIDTKIRNNGKLLNRAYQISSTHIWDTNPPDQAKHLNVNILYLYTTHQNWLLIWFVRWSLAGAWAWALRMRVGLLYDKSFACDSKNHVDTH